MRADDPGWTAGRRRRTTDEGHEAATGARTPAAGRALRGLVVLLLRVALVLVVVAAACCRCRPPAAYLVSGGSVTFQLRPAWPGGHLVMPLGPAGELSLRTHRTPVGRGHGLPSAGADGRAARRGARERAAAAGGRRPRGVHAGTCSGACPGCSWWARPPGCSSRACDAAAPALGRRRGRRRRAAARRRLRARDATRRWTARPEVRYAGLASRVPSVLPLLRALSAGGDQSDRLSRLQDFLDGLEAVATQLTTEPRRPARADVVRLLLASDIHDNVFGARAAARLRGRRRRARGRRAPRRRPHGHRVGARRRGCSCACSAPSDAPVLSSAATTRTRRRCACSAAPASEMLADTTVSIAGVRILGASDPVAEEAAGGVGRAGAGGRRRPPRRALAPGAAAAAGCARPRRAPGGGTRSPRRRRPERTLLVAYGNDHVAGVSSDDGVVLVDAGTAGASGYEAIGAASPTATAALEPSAAARDVYTYQLIDFSRADPRLAGGRDDGELRRGRPHRRHLHAVRVRPARRRTAAASARAGAASRAPEVESEAAPGAAPCAADRSRERITRGPTLRPARHRGEVAAPLEGARRLPHARRERQAQVLRPRLLPVPVRRRAQRRSLPQLRPHRRGLALQAHAGVQRAAPHGLGRLRPAGRELRHQDGRPPAGDHRAQHRQLPPADGPGRPVASTGRAR